MHFLGPLIGGGLAGLFQYSYHKTKKSMKKEELKGNMKFVKEVDVAPTEELHYDGPDGPISISQTHIQADFSANQSLADITPPAKDPPVLNAVAV